MFYFFDPATHSQHHQHQPPAISPFPAPPASIISISCLLFLFSRHPQPASSASAACRFSIPSNPIQHHQHQLPAVALFRAPPACIISISCLPFLYSWQPHPASSASAACRCSVPGNPSLHHQHQLPAVSLFLATPSSIISISCLPFLYSWQPQPASSASAACRFSIPSNPIQHHQHQLPAVALFRAPPACIISISCLPLLCSGHPQPASSASAACRFSIPGNPSQHHQHQLPAVSLFLATPASIISISCLPLLCSQHPQGASSAACRFSIPGNPSQHQ